jgi:hypothetical protein
VSIVSSICVEHLEVLLAQEGGQVVRATDGLPVPLLRTAVRAPRLGLVYQSLGRYAPDVDAGAAVHPAGLLNHHHPLALPSHRGGQRLPALAEAEN